LDLDEVVTQTREKQATVQLWNIANLTFGALALDLVGEYSGNKPLGRDALPKSIFTLLRQ
jgi:hypothetical protein